MFFQYQYYRRYTIDDRQLQSEVDQWQCEMLQAAVDHTDERYHCKKMSDCPYTGTTVINKIPWGDWPAGWVWSPQEADQEGGGMMEVRYDVVRDRYFTINTAGPDREEWWRGVWSWDNIGRRDYSREDTVYLHRWDSNKPGLIEWVVKVREGEMITRVVVRVESTDSDGASVEWELSGGDIGLPVSPGTELDTNQLAGASQISLQATPPLTDEKKDQWLFRASRTEEGLAEETQLKLLVYFARSGTEQDQQQDGQSQNTEICDIKGEVGIQEEDQAEEIDTDMEEEIIIVEVGQEMEGNVGMAVKKEETEGFIASQTGNNKRMENHGEIEEENQAEAKEDDIDTEVHIETSGTITRAVDTSEVYRADSPAGRCFVFRNCCNIL